MKTEITSKDYKDIYEACNWNPIVFSKALKAMRYSDELIVNGDLDLRGTPIQSMGNLKTVVGSLDLIGTHIQSLGNLQSVRSWLDLRGVPIQDLGNLKEVGGDLDLKRTSIRDLGNLKKVGSDLYLEETPLSKKYSEEEIRQMVNVEGDIHL